MVSDNDMGTDEGSTEETMAASEGSAESTYGAEQMTEAPQETTPEAEAKPKSKGGGRRAALKIIRQNVETVSKDLASFRKNHEVSAKKLEKQVAALRSDMNALKSYISKESARARSKQEASFSRILSKLNAPKPKPKKAVKKKAKPKPKGKK